MAEVPELWWSPSLAERRGWSDMRSGLVSCDRDGRVRRGFATGAPLGELPADAVLLVPAEPVDEKGRTPTYLRGFEDGRMAGCAGADAASSYLSAYARAAIDHRAAERAAEVADA